MSEQHSDSSESDIQLPFSWEIRMWEGQPAKRMAALFMSVAVGIVGWFFTQNIYLAILGTIVMFASTAEFFFSVKCELSEKGARAKLGLSTSFIEWDDVLRIWRTPEGIRLSPLKNPSKLDAFRGVLLRTSGNEEALLVTIARLSKNAELLDRRTDRRGGTAIDRKVSESDQEEKT